MFKKIVLTIFIFLVALIVILQFPNLFIEKKFGYNSFEVYSNNKLENNEDVRKILDSVSFNLSQSEFFRKEQVLELYFIKDSFYEKLVGIFGMNNIASSRFNTHIYIGFPNFKENELRKENNSYEWVNLIQIITHEGVHSQMYKDYSTFGFMETPNWINEGYCEYISYKPIRNENYNLFDLYEKYVNAETNWIKTEFNAMTPKKYLRDRIIIEYLIDVKQMDILSIIKDESLQLNDLLIEVENYFEKN